MNKSRKLGLGWWMGYEIQCLNEQTNWRIELTFLRKLNVGWVRLTCGGRSVFWSISHSARSVSQALNMWCVCFEASEAHLKYHKHQTHSSLRATLLCWILQKALRCTYLGSHQPFWHSIGDGCRKSLFYQYIEVISEFKLLSLWLCHLVTSRFVWQHGFGILDLIDLICACVCVWFCLTVY